MEFEPYLGWIDVPDPNNPPPGARLIGASDLLRYERALEEAESEFAGLAARFAARTHTHPMSQVTGLTTAIDAARSAAERHADAEVRAHDTTTTNVHGIADTQELLQVAQEVTKGRLSPTSLLSTVGTVIEESDTVAQAVNQAVPPAVANAVADLSVVQDDDSRLSDAREPTSHSHPVTDLDTDGTADESTFLRGDGRWATPPTGGEGGGVTDHGGLTGLGDDDHTQYALADGTRGAFAALDHDHDGWYVRTVNGTGPDSSGNVVVEGGGDAPGPVAWADVQDKPTEFPPVEHEHPEYLTEGDLPEPPDLSGYVRTDDSRLGDAREPTAHTHDEYADVDHDHDGRYVRTDDLPDAPTWDTLAGKPPVIAAGTSTTAARNAIGAGTSNLTLGTSAQTAKRGDWTPATSDIPPLPASRISDSTATGRSVLTATSAAAARTAIGAVASQTVTIIWTGTRAQYDALPVKDAATLYVITEV